MARAWGPLTADVPPPEGDVPAFMLLGFATLLLWGALHAAWRPIPAVWGAHAGLALAVAFLAFKDDVAALATRDGVAEAFAQIAAAPVLATIGFVVGFSEPLGAVYVVVGAIAGGALAWRVGGMRISGGSSAGR